MRAVAAHLKRISESDKKTFDPIEVRPLKTAHLLGITIVRSLHFTSWQEMENVDPLVFDAFKMLLLMRMRSSVPSRFQRKKDFSRWKGM